MSQSLAYSKSCVCRVASGGLSGNVLLMMQEL